MIIERTLTEGCAYGRNGDDFDTVRDFSEVITPDFYFKKKEALRLITFCLLEPSFLIKHNIPSP